MNIVLLLAHSIEEHDQVRLLSSLGYDVFSIGAYADPAHPGDDKRPPIPEAADHPELRAACQTRREEREGRDGPPGDRIDWAKADLPDAVIEWADVLICHHIEHTWLVPQWSRLRHKRVIWRTVGQSVEHNERLMRPLRDAGLQIVRYSPKERNIPGYLGEDALIRFWKDPAEWGGWTGEAPRIINVTQHLRQREPWTNWSFWEAATAGLPRVPLGPGSEAIGGPGALDYDTMRQWLRSSRAYLYTGTQPASYTLGLIEAMMTGIPVVSIGPSWMRAFPYGPALFEGHELTGKRPGLWGGQWVEDDTVRQLDFDDPTDARLALRCLLDDEDMARQMGADQRQRAIELFGRETVGRAWRDFLGTP